MVDVRPRLVGWLVLLLFAGSAPAADLPAAAPGDKAAVQYLRLTRDKNHALVALETPIVRFAPADSRRRAPVVDLVAAIHIAEKSYYAQLNREFEGYDAVLYELVAPEEAAAPQPGDPESNHPLSLLQNGMKDLLGLEFQLKGIDYTRANMIHADMSPDQFAESMRKRGETPMTMLGRIIGYAMARQDQSGGGLEAGQLLLALFDKNRAVALRRVLAEEFTQSEDMLLALEGPSGSTLLSGRNQVAIKVLRKEIAAGKRKIAIFYGAAHMSDFEKRLRTEFGLVPVSTRWLAAWNLRTK
jgi:hypothetical protein